LVAVSASTIAGSEGSLAYVRLAMHRKTYISLLRVLNFRESIGKTTLDAVQALARAEFQFWSAIEKLFLCGCRSRG